MNSSITMSKDDKKRLWIFIIAMGFYCIWRDIVFQFAGRKLRQ